MAGFTALLFAYVLGGLTFIPLLLLGFWSHAYFSLPVAPEPPQAQGAPVDDSERDHALEEKLSQHLNEPDAASGYFAVCREFVPAGVNGRPPERTTPTGELVNTDNPSVYQSMYRSIFDRNKAQQPTLEAGKSPRKGRNLFFVVIRHSHLVLFDNEQQLEIRHVLSLAHHTVDVYAGEEDLPEGELWIKRNCIRLKKKPEYLTSDSATAPFYLFADNSSRKEDFYHSLLRHQRQDTHAHEDIPAPLPFETDDMIKLIRQLHTSEENTQSRWLNALLGRLFLALYKTHEVESHVRNKISKKISRVAKPAFISSLNLRDVLLGDAAPSFMNPKLREMTVDGALTIEADVRYSGNFKAVIAAVARIDLGAKLKAREVSLVLAGVLRRLEGHVLFKIKPPPSNRIWISFETMPKLDISLEPIVSQRQITYGPILRAMVGRIQEVVAETVVLPNWDDLAFTNTERKNTRGGVWKHREEPQSFTAAEKDTENAASHELQKDRSNTGASSTEREAAVAESSSSDFRAEGASHLNAPNGLVEATDTGTLEPGQAHAASISTPAIAHTRDVEKPKAMRSHSFASAASPIVSKSPATTEGTRRRSKKGRKDAASAMQDLASRSPEMSPTTTPAKPILNGASNDVSDWISSEPSSLDDKAHMLTAPGEPDEGLTSTSTQPISVPRLRATSMTDPGVSTARSTSSKDRTKAFNHSLTAATAAATKWSLGMLNMQDKNSNASPPKLPPRPEPVGRGQPLPPPGMPLPKPEKSTWSNAALNTFRRKSGKSISESSSRSITRTNSPAGKDPDPADDTKLDQSSLSQRDRAAIGESASESALPPSLKIDRASDTTAKVHEHSNTDNLMTISAPSESAPSTPRPRTPEPDYAKQMGEELLTRL
ncbi:MAG: hypothetical protein Q9162_003292 [Coniocarpon cinnabarinum]